jgi:putative Mg2+ transporter-C (MgtC) family protein
MAGDTEIVVRLLLASLLGGAVGLEREMHGREAGIRTYLLVALGSALIMVVSEYIVLEYQSPALRYLGMDPGRIAAQAITGIGFLGAGAIIRYRNSTRGLTTAACMWVVCAIGLAVGAGYYLFSVTVSAVTVGSLVGLKALERRLKRDWYRDLLIMSDDIDGQLDRVHDILDRNGVKVNSFGLTKNREKKELMLEIKVRFHSVQPLDRDIVNYVSDIEGIRRVELR